MTSASASKFGKAWILTIGNELLIGRVINTNASWLAKKLSFLGLTVQRIITVPDTVDDIAEELNRGIERAHVIITTGGLGPTYDDMTLEGVAKAVGRPLEVHEYALEMVKQFYQARGLELTPERVKMARLPRGSIPLPNPVGAAPGMWLEYNDSIIISLPGVPREMESMFESHVEARIRDLYPSISVIECGILVKGVPESTLAPDINRLARRYKNVYIKSHPKGHETQKPILEIKVMVSSSDRRKALEEASRVLGEVESIAESLGGEVGKKSCV
ncbi:MAG: nicotinamide mononucleotide deamidase-related protein [Desulfurococcales archaeon]|nr:nicotinamide mononucleotide deamidase-related protein [Desulfurococcales archaeon]